MISVIIPIYNRDYCLSRCLESVLHQTFTDWECILIDDGSTDKSLSVCRSYEAKDSRFRVYTQPNGGVSAARNKGIEQACGEYIAFIDSDDWVEPEFLQLLYESAGKRRMSLCSMDSQKAGECDNNCKHRSALYGGEGDLIDLLTPEFFYLLVGPVCKLYDRSIIETYHIRFPYGYSWGEDVIFNSLYLQYIDKIKGIPLHLYHVVVQDKSLSEDAKSDFFLTDKNQIIWQHVSNNFKNGKGVYGLGLDYFYNCLFLQQLSGIRYVHEQLSWIKRYKRMKYLIQSADRNVLKRYRFKNIRFLLIYYKLSALVYACYEINYFLVTKCKKES